MHPSNVDYVEVKGKVVKSVVLEKFREQKIGDCFLLG